MQRHIAQPARLDLDSPGRRDYWVAIEHDTMWGAHFVPLTVIVGPDAAAHPERGLVAFGATHGNEYEGPVAIKQLLHEIRTEDVLGRLILVPVLNAAAFRIGQRDSMEDDRVNLNRAFVDNAGEARRIASPSSSANSSGPACMYRSTSMPAGTSRSSRCASGCRLSARPSRPGRASPPPGGSARRW
jgi:predicted deacylase